LRIKETEKELKARKVWNRRGKWNSRIGDVAEEMIGAEILDVDTAQVAAAIANCAAAHDP